MDITARVALEVATHEAVVRQTYLDSKGVRTWSVGLTNASGHSVERYIGKPATMRRCLEVYVWALQNYAEAVRAEFAGHELTEAQFAAALSFHWNTGSIRSASWPDHWKAGRVAEARESFMAWRKPAEIIPRRRAEAALFFDGVWSGDGFLTEWTRLTSRSTPDWSSGRRVDVRADLEALLSGDVIGEEPVPEAPETIRPIPRLAPLQLRRAESQIATALGEIARVRTELEA